MARNYDYTCSIMSNWCPICLRKDGGVNPVGGEYHVPRPVTLNELIWRCENGHEFKIHISKPHNQNNILLN